MRLKCLMLMLLLAGCSSTKSYTINVHNDALEPMTVWLTKDGNPPEAGWLAPEQIAMLEMKKVPITGVVIPAGRTATMTEQTGQFDSGTHAVLRIYRGQKHFNELLAIDDTSPNRIDLILVPGINQIKIDQHFNATRK